jgi:hypothetical protein
MGKKLTCRRAGQASARVFRTARGSCGISESNGRTSPGSPPVLQPALDAPDLVNTVAVLEPFIASSSWAVTEVRWDDGWGSMYATGDRVGAVEVFPLAVAVMASVKRSIERCRPGTSCGGLKRPTRSFRMTPVA